MSLIKLKKINVKLRIATLLLMLLAVTSFSYCSDVDSYGNSNLDSESDIFEDVEDEEPEVVPWTPEPEPPPPECIECKWYFCPPLNEVWKKEICFNTCEDPPVLHSESECIQYMECDPAQYLIDEVPCTTEDGHPGVQQKVCNKGLIQYTDCVSDCEEETCDYEDNDCDGEIDEGQLNACNECGIIPAEDCNGIDDDCDGDTDEGLIQPCSTACGAGYEMCDNGNWISCTAPPVNDEICDGLDNDCDGQIDEDLECICTIQDIGTLFPCQEDPLLCGQGYKTCECLDPPDCKTLIMTDCYALCHWLPPVDPNNICDPLIGMALADEKCNNFDDDCDQEIDEDLYVGCYTGPEGTLMVGICIPGEMTCDKGTWGSYDDNEVFIPYYCEGEIVPQEEICNGIDDNCDGITDWGEEMQETDVLFIVDWSGSMSDEMGAVMIALNQFAQNFSDEEVIKWGFVRGPVGILPPPNQSQPSYEQLEIYQNLVGFTEFLSSLSVIDASHSTMNTAFEMLIDAIYLSVKNISSILPYDLTNAEWDKVTATKTITSVPSIDKFDVNWRPGANRIIIVFSDEHPQSYMQPPILLDNVEDAVSGVPQLKLYTFSRDGSDKLKWEQIANAGNGQWYKLTNNPTEMYVNLMEILDEICKGGASE